MTVYYELITKVDSLTGESEERIGDWQDLAERPDPTTDQYVDFDIHTRWVDQAEYDQYCLELIRFYEEDCTPDPDVTGPWE